MSNARSLGYALLLCPLFSRQAVAGMPMVSLTEIAQFRLSALSFFLMAILISAWIVQRIWNALRKDFQSLPRLSYPKALLFIAIWGFAFNLLLTMISGARELMMPEAWDKAGLMYTLDSGRDRANDSTRRANMERLKDDLKGYAEAHNGLLPPNSGDPAVRSWVLADAPGDTSAIYIGGRTWGVGNAVVAYEPSIFGTSRWVIFSDGRIEKLGDAELRQWISGEGR